MDEDQKKFVASSRHERPAVDLLNRIFEDATRRETSDVHFEDGPRNTEIRMRLGGDLEPIEFVESHLALLCDAKIRSACQMSLSERKEPIDGRMYLDIDGRRIEIRVSIMPTTHGQSTVCRLLDQKNARRELATIDMSNAVRSELQRCLEDPIGLILVTGPTGSGKTSTLYAMLNELNSPQSKIVTIEDPVEYTLPRAQQVNVNERMTFARALRSVLRQDPDTIMVGEMRDSETAKIAIQAALTGHLVLSTLHTNDFITTMTRLFDLGIDPDWIADVLRGAIAQRLAKRLCQECREPSPLTNNEMAWLEAHGPAFVGQQFFTSCGCEACGQTGAKGRIPIMEMGIVDHPMRLAIQAKNRSEMLRAARNQPQYQTLGEAGLTLATQGLVSLAQVRKIASDSATIPGPRPLLDAQVAPVRSMGLAA